MKCRGRHDVSQRPHFYVGLFIFRVRTPSLDRWIIWVKVFLGKLAKLMQALKDSRTVF